MGRDVDSDALVLVEDQLGMSGIAPQLTRISERDLTQIFDVGAAVRRGRADIGTTGWFYCLFTHVHAGAGGLFSFIDPYAATALNAEGSYPEAVNRKFDVWLLGSSCRISATGILTIAGIRMSPTDRMQGLGEDGAGAANPGSTHFTMAAFTQELAALVGGIEMADVMGRTYVPHCMRVPRGASLGGLSQAAGAGTVNISCIIGLFPVGMGQDIGCG